MAVQPNGYNKKPNKKPNNIDGKWEIKEKCHATGIQDVVMELQDSFFFRILKMDLFRLLSFGGVDYLKRFASFSIPARKSAVTERWNMANVHEWSIFMDHSPGSVTDIYSDTMMFFFAK